MSDSDASKSEDLRFAAARVYFMAAMYDDAEPLLKVLSEERPEEARYHYHLGFAQLQRGELDAAREQFVATLEAASHERGIDSHVPFAHVGLGNILSRRGDHERAALEFEEAVNSYRHGYLQNGYAGLSRELELAGDIDGALTALRREVFLNERPSARTALSRFYARHGDSERADAEARRAEELAQ
jgi:tetratricopeptide (TPR) repeat protein